MPVAEITHGKRVAELADVMSAQGLAVSASALRQAMEGSVPYSKVYSALAEWRAHQPGSSRLPDVPLLEGVEQTLKSVMEIVWRAGAIQARDGIKGLRDAVASRLAVLEAQLGDAVGEIARLENESQYNARKLNELATDFTKVQAIVTSKETENVALREQFREFRQREREFIDKIEILAGRAAAAEAELRNAVASGSVPILTAQVKDERKPSSH